MKRIVSMVCCGIIMLSCTLVWANASNTSDDEVMDSSKLSDAIVYDDFKGPLVDPKIALEETFGEELANEILNAGPDDLIMFDLVNESAEVVHCPSTYSAVESTEAFIPEGLDVAQPLAAKGNPDSMAQIEYPSVNSFPYSTNAFLEITYKDGSKVTGSGVFVDKRVILTAGHLLYNPYSKQYAAQIDVTPGGSLSKYTTVPVTGMSISQKWITSLAKDYDYGAICIGESQGTGHLGMSTKTDAQLKNMSLVGVYGYPNPNDAGRGTLWYGSGKIAKVEPLLFSFTNSTGSGFSGGPVVDMADYKNVTGILVFGDGTDSIATRLTSSIINFVQNFKDHID